MASCSQPERANNVSASNTTRADRSCAFDVCQAIENLKLCGRCKGTWYCSKEHQKKHWQIHKTSCKKITNPLETIANVEKELHGDILGITNNQNVTGDADGDSKNTTGAPGMADVKLEEDTEVQEDIAQFSAKIRRKHSFTLTPCESDTDDLLQKGIERENNTDPSSEGTMKTPNKKQENFPPSKKVAGGPVLLTESNTNALVDYITDYMRKFGVCVVDKFLRQDLGDAILDEVVMLRESNEFQSGQLVTSLKTGSSKDIRGDMIAWSDGSTLQTKNIGCLISKIDLVIQQCKEHLEGFQNINGRTEAMIACYPGNGTHYVKHVDNPNKDGRCITCIYYLNKGWDSKKMGGTLQLYPRDHNMMANVDPIFNRLIVFWSDRRNPHEVLPAYNTRYAITVWYFDSVERKKALQTALS